MLTSLALIFLVGLLFGKFFYWLKLPLLLGMMLAGTLLGPYGLGLLDDNLLLISADLRQLALVIILTRAGLALQVEDLKKVGRPAVLLCFLPAVCEMVGVVLLAPLLLGVSRLDAAIMGSVLAAVSPAVVVPRMLKLMEEGYGKKAGIPSLILAGASVDDVFVIVVFTAFTGLAANETAISATDFLQVPVSIVLGSFAGWAIGYGLQRYFRMFHMRDSVKVLILLSVSFLLVQAEDSLEGMVPFSGLLAIMTMGIALLRFYPVLAGRLSQKYNKLWVAAEVTLFSLVGATVNISYALQFGVAAILVVAGALVFRMGGVCLCVAKTSLSPKERLFTMLAYTPKATVQAAIGGIPLSMGLGCGEMVLTVAVLAILMTAPFGAVCIDHTYQRLLQKE